MRELISHPELQFWIYSLEGKLAYTHFIPGQLPRQYLIHKNEFKGLKQTEEGGHLQLMVGQGGTPRSFSTSILELSIVVMKVDGTLNMEYHYDRRGFQKLIFQGFGPWPVETQRAGLFTQHPRFTDESTAGEGNVLMSNSNTRVTQEVPMQEAPTQDVSPDPQENSIHESESSPAMPETVPDTQETPSDTQETPPEILVTPPDMKKTPQDTQKAPRNTHSNPLLSNEDWLSGFDPYHNSLPYTTRRRH
jgi:hypothetical protein